MVISDVLCILDLCKTVNPMVTHKMSILFEDGKVEVYSTEMVQRRKASTSLVH